MTSLPANNPRYPGSIFPNAVDIITNAPAEMADAVMATQQSLVGGGPTGTALANVSATSVSATNVVLTGGPTLRGGSGAPATGLGVIGDYYLRTDTPSTALQRIYVKTAAAVWTGIA